MAREMAYARVAIIRDAIRRLQPHSVATQMLAGVDQYVTVAFAKREHPGRRGSPARFCTSLEVCHRRRHMRTLMLFIAITLVSLSSPALAQGQGSENIQAIMPRSLLRMVQKSPPYGLLSGQLPAEVSNKIALKKQKVDASIALKVAVSMFPLAGVDWLYVAGLNGHCLCDIDGDAGSNAWGNRAFLGPLPARFGVVDCRPRPTLHAFDTQAFPMSAFGPKQILGHMA